MTLETTGLTTDNFDTIFNRWYAHIRNFIYYKTGDVDVAEDLAQDAFMKIWEKKESIRAESVKSLLYKIASNLIINRLEHTKVSLKFNNSVPLQHNTMSPEYELEMKEFDNRLQLALAALDEKNRTVFLMSRIDDMTYNEIADSLGLTVKAIEKRMEKALAFLRVRMQVKL